MKTQRVLLALVGAVLGALVTAAFLLGPEWLRHRGHDHEEAAAGRKYTCSMHPEVVRDEPGNCPICGMSLTPVRDTPTADMDEEHDDHGDEAEDRTDLVRVDRSFLQNFAVRTETAERGAVVPEVRTVGILGYNQERIFAVTTKYDGWIEKAYVNTPGERVVKGQPLFDVYSPELVATQREYLAAAAFAERMRDSPRAEAAEQARALVTAARERLGFWDVTEEQIAEIQAVGQPHRAMTVYAPVSGELLRKASDSLEGLRIMPGMAAMTIADSSKLWAEIKILERDIGRLSPGSPASIEVEPFPGRRWNGRIALFQPLVDQQARTLTAFVEVDNPGQRLRPGMYAEVLLRPPGAPSAVRISEQAVIHTGERSVVIVQRRRGVFEPREVEIGLSAGGYVEVRRGLEPGETVVTSSQFLIDSESNLRAAIQQMGGEAPPHQH